MKKTIIVGFSKRKNFSIISKLIRFVEDTDFSHTFISWKCERINRIKLYESVATGIRIINNKKFKEKSEVIELYEFEVEQNDLYKIERYTHDNCGISYGYKHILGILLMRVVNKFYKIIKSNKRIKNPFKDGKLTQICVEAGAYVVEISTKKKLPGNVEDYGLVEFKEYVKKHGKKLTTNNMI